MRVEKLTMATEKKATKVEKTAFMKKNGYALDALQEGKDMALIIREGGADTDKMLKLYKQGGAEALRSAGFTVL